MNKFLLAGAAVLFAGVAATVAVAADHKTKPAEKPMHATVVTPAKNAPAHKAGKKHHASKKHHHAVSKAHAK